MYLIQQTTNQPTDEILGFFYDFGKEVFIIGVQNMKTNQRSIRKQIEAIYPGTHVPFKILVEGGKSWGSNGFHGDLYVTFPDNTSYMDTEKIIEAIMERTLLGGSSLPPIEPPKSKTPKMYKDLIKKVLEGKSNADILNSGYTWGTDSTDESLDESDDES